MLSSHFCKKGIETKTTYTSVFPSLKRLHLEVSRLKGIISFKKIQNNKKKINQIMPMNSLKRESHVHVNAY